MSEFKYQVDLRLVGDNQWQTLNDIKFISKKYDVIVVPRMFRTDLASVPRVLWWIIPPHGKHAKASILHDFVIVSGWRRKEADTLFREALKASGVGIIRRRLMYLSVRVHAIFTVGFS